MKQIPCTGSIYILTSFKQTLLKKFFLIIFKVNGIIKIIFGIFKKYFKVKKENENTINISLKNLL